MTQPPWPPGRPGDGSAPPPRIRPPWLEAGARRPELIVWAAVGLVAWFAVPLLAYALISRTFGNEEVGALTALVLAAVTVLAAVVAVTFGPSRVRAVGYGMLIAVGLALALVALAVIVAAGLLFFWLSNR